MIPARELGCDGSFSNHHPALSFCLSMISAQTLCVCREGKPASTFPDHALARLQPQCFDRSAMLPVAISGSHDALPRPGA